MPTVMRCVFVLCMLSLISGSVLAQSAEKDAPARSTHAVPFASEGNRIELAVANVAAGEVLAGPVRVTVAEVPAWLSFEPQAVTLDTLAAGTEAVAVFTFAVAQTAPVAEPAALRFTVAGRDGVVGETVISLMVEAPKEVALLGNYPNPFNPTTTLAYTLPRAAQVRLTVYDVLGREVARLQDREQGAGYHEVAWEAGRYASGVYVYRLAVEDVAQGHTLKQGTMLLLK